MRERFKTLGVTPIPPEPPLAGYLTKFVQSEIERWGAPIKASGVQIE